MPQRNVASNFTFEQQRVEINNLAQDFWTQKGTVDTAAPTYLKHDGSNAFTGQTLAVPNAFTINSNSGNGTVTISGNLDVTGTTTTVSSANLEVTDKNILIAKGSTSDAQADGAGITIDSATDITFNFVDNKDALVSSIGLEGTTFLKAPYGQFTGSGTPTAGQGIEINAPDANTGQISSYDRGGSAYKELRVKGSSVGVYAGTSNSLVGSFSSTGLSVTGTVTASDNVTITGNKEFKIESSSSGDYVRMYAGGGTGKWDIYGNGANLRFSDNESAGSVVFDRNVDANGGLDVGAPASNSLTHKLLVQAATDANAIAVIGRTDGIGELSFYANDASTKQGEVQFRDAELNIRHRKEGAEINFATTPTGGSITDRLTITSDGKVGINITDNTTADLHVREGNTGAGIFRVGGGTGGATGLDIDYSNSGTTKTIIKQNYRATNAGAELSFDSGFFTFMVGTTGNTEALRIESSGNLIPGTTGTQNLGSGSKRWLDVYTENLNVTKASGNLSTYITATSGLGTIEIAGSTGAFIDLKTPGTDDFDMRVGTSGTGGYINTDSNSTLSVNCPIIPDANGSYDLGGSGNRWANVYSADLQLSNKGSTNEVDGTWGDFTIQEGESDLFLINRRNGKKYKFNITEV